MPTGVEKMMALRGKKAAEVVELERQLLAAKAELAGYDKILSVGGLLESVKGTKALQVPKPAKAVPEPPVKARRPKTAVKQIVLEIVRAAGDAGINVEEAVAKARAQGKSLPAESVAVFLRRAKGEGLLTYEYEGQRYRIKP